MKKIFIKVFALLFIFTIFLSNSKIANATDFPVLEAQGVVLMDGHSGEILYSQNPDTLFEPASTTKVMTALVVLDRADLNEKVVIGKNPPLVDGSAIGIREGEIYSIKELLLGLLLESGNDCAEALAEYISGSNAEFGKLMTEEAHKLGATSTTFKNPSGLSEEGHLTTAHDLAVIMKSAANNDKFVEISRTESYFYKEHPFSDGTEKWATNRNNCYVDWSPYYYEYLYCGKTGWTPEANHTYTAAAKKNDQLLIASFLNAFDKGIQYSSVGPLFEWGFENFTTKKLITESSIIDEIKLNDEVTLPLLATKDIYYTYCSTDTPKLSTDISYTKKDLSKTSLTKGEILFNATILVDGNVYDTMDLSSGIDRAYMYVETPEGSTISFSKILPIIIVVLIVLIIIFISIFKYKSKRKSFLEKRSFIRKKHFRDY